MKNTARATRFATAALALLAIVSSTVTAQEAPTPEQMQAMAEKAARLSLPEGVIQLSPCEPGMGEHWADPKNMPLGPIYGVVGEEVVFVEIMPAQADFAEGQSWDEVLVPPVGHTIDHVDIDFMPKGHPGYEVPHYDIHAYFASHSEHMAYCPPNTAAGAATDEHAGSH